MPLIKVLTNAPGDAKKQEAVTLGLSKIAVEITGKPEQYVQAIIREVAIRYKDTEEPAAFADAYSIGLRPDMHVPFTQKVGELLEKELGVPQTRFFINLHNPAGGDWGWNGRTFG
eukprot:tig00021070_g17825.t1